MMQRCRISGVSFEISHAEQEFRERIGVPQPTLCPEERARRRMVFANQRHLFHRTCALTGKRIISNVPPEDPTPIFDIGAWFGDGWNQYATGRDIDFSRPFFPQFKELMAVAPRPALQRAPQFDHNSDFTNYAGKNKNCYLIFDSDKCEQCLYSYSVNSCRDVVDSFRVDQSELCYECVDCVRCYESTHLQNCDSVTNSRFMKNCVGCSECIGCVNLRQKRHCIFNQQYSVAEFARRAAEFQIQTHSGQQRFREEFAKFALGHPERAVQGMHNENCVGDYLVRCKNAFYCFDSRNLWDCHHVIQAFDDARDCAGCVEIGDGAELLYECSYMGYQAYGNRFSTHALGQSSNLYYCFFCPLSSDCFGCVGLHHGKYCIFNEQYSESDYRALTARLIDHMKSTGEWGEFFPAELAPFPYNLTHAYDAYPLSREEAASRGYRWYEEKVTECPSGSGSAPETIGSVSDDVLQQTFACEVSGKPFKFQRAELEFYRKMNLPPPRVCGDERYKCRLAMRNPRMLRTERSAVSGREIVTTVPAGRAVVSEEEFASLLA